MQRSAKDCNGAMASAEKLTLSHWSKATLFILPGVTLQAAERRFHPLQVLEHDLSGLSR